MIKALILDGKDYTIPLRYNIVKDSRSVRTLSLPHPKGQAMLAEFYKKYEELICEYASRGPFSIRAPEKVGSSFFTPSIVENKNSYKNITVDTMKLVSGKCQISGYSYPVH